MKKDLRRLEAALCSIVGVTAFLAYQGLDKPVETLERALSVLMEQLEELLPLTEAEARALCNRITARVQAACDANGVEVILTTPRFEDEAPVEAAALLDRVKNNSKRA